MSILLSHAPAAFHLLAAFAEKSSSKSSSSSGSSSFIFILLILAVGAFLFIRPQRRRQREQQAMQRSISVGDEVVTSAGIVGRVKAMNDDRVQVEVAPGTTIEIVRRSIGQRVASPTWSEQGSGEWNVPASPDSAGDKAPGDSSAEKWGFPSPSPKSDPDDNTPGEGTGGSG